MRASSRLAACVAFCAACAARGAAAGDAFRTPLSAEDLDPAAFAQWVDGAQSPMPQRDGPRHVVWTANSRPEWDGVRFGDGKRTDPRHLRVGFARAVEVGAVLARGGGRLSVLSPAAAYPGDPSDEAQWVPAERLDGREVASRGAGREDIVLWALPPGTSTRALRFTHVPKPTDSSYAGYLGGAWVLSGRAANVATQANAFTRRNPDGAHKINNGSNDGTWGAWDNGAASEPLSATNYEPLTLVWPAEVRLRGLCAVWAGASGCEVMAYAGPAGRHPRQAEDRDWRLVGRFDGMDGGYPLQLWPNWMDFGREVAARAVQVRITGTTREGHPHMNGRTKGGRFTWMGELMALVDLGGSPLASAVLPALAEPDLGHPPIPVRFTLKEPGFVTLVIDDAEGNRVRNLVSATRFPAGRNTVWWDATDDLGRDVDSARHGLYSIPAAFVKPGTYTVRGLTRRQIDLRFEFSVYNAGSPAWTTEDRTGGWTTNHTPPRCVAFVPAGRGPGDEALVYIGSYVAEGGDGLAWVNLDGKKRGGRGWIGGNWTGAKLLAYDAGPKRDASVAVYVASDWEGELRLCAMDRNNNPRDVAKWRYPDKTQQSLSSVAARDGLLVCALPKTNELLFADALGGGVLGSVACERPAGVAFDAAGDLYVLQGARLVCCRPPEDLRSRLGAGRGGPRLEWTGVVERGLEDPQQVCFDRQGRIYVSDRGSSHQVKVFTPAGRYVSAIGKPGAPRAGAYDERHMNNPNGIAVDHRDRLWVAEEDYQPKRVSVWDPRGGLVRAFYGPSEYGGGGTLDPRDRTRFYYRGLEFRLDWTAGTDRLVNVLLRPQEGALLPADGYGSGGMPETPHYVEGRRYFSNWNDSNPTNGAGVAAIWADRGGIAHPVAAAGNTKGWSRINNLLGGASQFSVRWTGKLVAPAGGEWKLYTVSDDGVRLWVGGKLVIDNWTDHGPTENSASVSLAGGARVDVKLEYYQGGGGAVTRLLWEGPGQPKAAVPSSRLVPAGSTEPRGLSAEYFRGRDLAQKAMTRVDPVVDFDWPGGSVSFDAGPDAAAMRARLPEGANPQDDLFFVWSDLNADEAVQPQEVQFLKGSTGGITVGKDLTFTAARIDGRCTSLPPVRYERDVPVYDVKRATVTATDVYWPASSGGDQALVAANGWTVLSLGVKPLAQHSLTGVRGGAPRWSYPDLWPGLHASHEAPAPSFPGELIGTTRLLGGLFEPRGSDAGPLWAINGNMGEMYVLTVDGLFVASLFRDVRQGAPWSMPAAERGMLLNDVSPHDENFWPTLTQTSDGGIYVVDGGRTSIVRVDGMESIRRLADETVRLTERDLQDAQAYHVRRELARQAALGSGVLAVEIRAAAPVLDGKLDEWSSAEWATIDRRGTAAWFDSSSRPYDVAAAACVHGDGLYVAWRTTEKDLLRNSGEMPTALFKTGGCLDVMIGADPGANDARTAPARGDVRLLVTRVGGKTRALVYRAVVPGTREPVPFSSPWRTITIDRVDDVSDVVRLAQEEGGYEVSMPLATLGLAPRPGMSIRADLGVLRGDGMQTLQRVYWANKGTAITSDVPSEAMLTPALWGRWRFK